MPNLIPIKKVSKQGALYIHRKGTDYQCKDCIMFIPDKERCLIHSDVQVIKPEGTCGYFVKGKPYPGLRPTGALSKLESGYIDYKPTGGCDHCEYFFKTKKDCMVVDKDTPGDDPGSIEPDACCANFERR